MALKESFLTIAINKIQEECASRGIELSPFEMEKREPSGAEWWCAGFSWKGLPYKIVINTEDDWSGCDISMHRADIDDRFELYGKYIGRCNKNKDPECIADVFVRTLGYFLDTGEWDPIKALKPPSEASGKKGLLRWFRRS